MGLDLIEWLVGGVLFVQVVAVITEERWWNTVVLQLGRLNEIEDRLQRLKQIADALERISNALDRNNQDQ